MVDNENRGAVALDEDEAGQVQIADDVIAVIAEIATVEVEGMIATGQGKTDLVQTIRGKKASRGIHVQVQDGGVFVKITGTVKYGVKIPELCVKVQKNVKASIETMTGLEVKNIDINVCGVYIEKSKVKEEY